MITEKFISKEDFLQIITESIYIKERTVFNIVPELSIKNTEYGETIDMKIYAERFFNGEKIRVEITEEEIKSMLGRRVRSSQKELESFLYVGGIHHVGYAFDEDTPYFEGVQLYIKEKDKKNDKYLQKK